jgi:hypothetical protein
MSHLQAEMISSKSPYLNIRDCDFNFMGGVESLARILKLNSNIKALGLGGCHIDDDGARVIAEILKENSLLR